MLAYPRRCLHENGDTQEMAFVEATIEDGHAGVGEIAEDKVWVKDSALQIRLKISHFSMVIEIVLPLLAGDHYFEIPFYVGRPQYRNISP